MDYNINWERDGLQRPEEVVRAAEVAGGSALSRDYAATTTRGWGVGDDVYRIFAYSYDISLINRMCAQRSSGIFTVPLTNE